jgi:hypothetical protein
VWEDGYVCEEAEMGRACILHWGSACRVSVGKLKGTDLLEDIDVEARD